MRVLVIIFAVLILLIAMPLLFYRYVPKEHFTEMYFNNPENLPKMMKTGNEYNFSFTIISHEKNLKSYEYSMESPLISEKGSFPLFPGENITMTKSIKAESLGEGNMTISLDSGQEIHFFYYILE